MPFGDPGGGRVANGDERVEDGGRAFGDGVGRVLQLQEGLTIGAARADELLDQGGKGISILEGRREVPAEGRGIGYEQWWF